MREIDLIGQARLPTSETVMSVIDQLGLAIKKEREGVNEKEKEKV